MTRFALRLRGGLLLACALAFPFGPASRADVILSDNLANATGGTEQVTADTWLAASFATDGSAYTLSAVTLLLQRASVGGTVQLSLYSDGGLEPGSLLGTLTSPGSVASTLGEVTFTTSGLNLAAGTTYWVALRATTGTFDWAWTSDNTGAGPGFRKTWSSTSDAGATWFTTDNFPFQMRVSAQAVPEPNSLSLIGIGALTIAAARLRRPSRA